MAAWTVTINDRTEIGGNVKMFRGTLAATGTYTTAGDSVDSSTDERFAQLIALPGGTTATGKGYKPEWTAATQLLVMTYFDYDAGADGAAIEVPNGTNLTGITALPFIAFSD